MFLKDVEDTIQSSKLGEVAQVPISLPWKSNFKDTGEKSHPEGGDGQFALSSVTTAVEIE